MTDLQISRQLERILASSEFQQPPESYWAAIWRRLEETLSAVGDWLAALGPGGRTVVVAVCLVLLAAIGLHAWAIYRSGRGERRTKGTGRGAAAKQLDPESLATLALEHARSGNARAAARTVQRAAYLFACRRAGVPWRETTADWEWVDQLSGAFGEGTLSRFTSAAQEVAYGPADDPAAFERCWSLFVEMREAHT